MTVRIATQEDSAAISAIYAPIVEGSGISFEEVAPPPDELADRITRTLSTHPWLVFEKDGDVTAYAYATPHRSRAAYRWSCETSVYVSAAARRTGAARTLYLKLFETLRALGYANALAGITLPNDPSRHFHEAMGFELIGIYPKVGFKSGAWRDVGWWNLSLQQMSDTPSNPLPFSENTHVFISG